MIVGPNWKGDLPPGIAGVVRSSTDYAAIMPRIFMEDTSEDHAAIQPLLNQIMLYPLSQFDGKMKTKDWSKLPRVLLGLDNASQGGPPDVGSDSTTTDRQGRRLRGRGKCHSRRSFLRCNPSSVRPC
jgi:Protein of unknown function (DUF1254)